MPLFALQDLEESDFSGFINSFNFTIRNAVHDDFQQILLALDALPEEKLTKLKLSLKKRIDKAPLVEALEAGNEEAVQALFARPYFLSDAPFALFHLLNNKHPKAKEYIELMLQHDLDVVADASISDQRTYTRPKTVAAPIYYAARFGDLQLVETMLQGKIERVQHSISEAEKEKHKWGTYGKDNPLHGAVRGRHGMIVRYLAYKGLPLDAVGASVTGTPLQLACELGYEDMALTLIHLGADKSKRSDKLPNPLGCALLGGHLSLAERLMKEGVLLPKDETFQKQLLEEGTDAVIAWAQDRGLVFDYSNEDLFTTAIKCRHTNVVNDFIGQGAPATQEVYKQAVRKNNHEVIEYCLTHGQVRTSHSVIKSICYKRNFDALPLLVKHGIDLDPVNKDGLTPLFSRVSHGDAKGVAALLANGANGKHILADGRNLISLYFDEGIKYDRKRKILTLLLDADVDLHYMGASPQTVFHLLSKMDDQELLTKTFAKVPELVDQQDNNGCTALHRAVLAGARESIAFFLNKGCDLSTKSNHGFAPLHMVRSGEIVELLVGAGADITAQDYYGNTLLHLAIERGDIETATHLVDNYPQLLSMANNKGDLPLHVAARKQLLTDLKQPLLNHPETRNLVNTQNHKGDTVLHIAMRNKTTVRVMEKLINQGASVEMVNRRGRTAIHVAFENPGERMQIEVVSFIKRMSDAAAALNQQDNLGNTVMHLGGEVYRKFLIEQGADPSVQNIFGLTAEEVAKKDHNDNPDFMAKREKVCVAIREIAQLPEDTDNAVSFEQAITQYFERVGLHSVEDLFDTTNPLREMLLEGFMMYPPIRAHLTRPFDTLTIRGQKLAELEADERYYYKHFSQLYLKGKWDGQFIPFRIEYTPKWETLQRREDGKSTKLAKPEELLFETGTHISTSRIAIQNMQVPEASKDFIKVDAAANGDFYEISRHIGRTVSEDKTLPEQVSGDHPCHVVYPCSKDNHATVTAVVYDGSQRDVKAVLLLNSWRSGHYSRYILPRVFHAVGQKHSIAFMDISMNVQLNQADVNCGIYNKNLALAYIQLLHDNPDIRHELESLGTYKQTLTEEAKQLMEEKVAAISARIQEGLKPYLPQYFKQQEDGSYQRRSNTELFRANMKDRWEAGSREFVRKAEGYREQVLAEVSVRDQTGLSGF